MTTKKTARFGAISQLFCTFAATFVGIKIRLFFEYLLKQRINQKSIIVQNYEKSIFS